MSRSRMAALAATGPFFTWAGAKGIAANSSHTNNTKVNLRRIIGSPRKMNLKSLSVVAGTRTRDQVRPVHDRNLHPAPTPVARRIRRLVTETVNLAEIVDHLLVHAVQVR